MPTLYLSPDRADLYCVRRSPCSLVLVCHGGDAALARVHHSWGLLGAAQHETSKRRGIAQRCVRTAAAVTVFTHPSLASTSRARYAYLRLQQAMPSQAAEPRQQSTPVSTASWGELLCASITKAISRSSCAICFARLIAAACRG
ncbi:hypothetical protein JKP88DRAFT_246003 [Tribonema minus]|uniref:Uncharacterized protein n=1 Tax=Tribonema minus TaxID=303371 RepID=A0A835Z403_9STRA|nr:hypothetical protein JKP88DRAFT_246003 [Tribonema minus]